MNSRNDIQRELESGNSSLPFDVRMPVFDLPQGYFENFAAGVLARIKGETAATAAGETEALSPLLAGLSRKMPYALPPDYFTHVLAPASGQDPIPGWGSEARQMPYTVPAGYFNSLASEVAAQVQPRSAKVVPMFARKWVQYAAAAVITGALVLAGLLYQGKPGVDPAADTDAWVAKKLDDVSNQELDAFFSATGLNGTETVQQAGTSKTEVRKMLQDVPSSELDAFLNQLPAGSEHIN